MGSQRECPKKLSGASSVLTASSLVSCLSLYTGMSKTRTTLGYWNCTVDKFVEASVLLLGGEKATGFCSSGRRKKLREVVRQHKEKPKKLTGEGMGAIPDVSRTSAIPHNSRVKFKFKHNNGVWVDRIPAWIKYAIVDSSKFVSTFDGVYWDPPTSGSAEGNMGYKTTPWSQTRKVAGMVSQIGAIKATLPKAFRSRPPAVREYKDFALSEYARVGRELTLYEGKLQLSTVLLVFQVRDVKWDAKFGVQNIELRLVEYFVDKFKKQVGNVFDVGDCINKMLEPGCPIRKAWMRWGLGLRTVSARPWMRETKMLNGSFNFLGNQAGWCA
ncbi:1,4-alpha-glucan-branching enzyme-like protein isoform X1 [Tanacetum coccineum]